MSKPIPQELEDIFNIIPRDGSNIKDDESQEGAYAAVVNNNNAVSFDEKAAEVSQKIAKTVLSKEEVEYVSQPPKAEVKIAPIVAEPTVALPVEPVRPVTPISNKEGSSNGKELQTGHERVLAEALSNQGNIGVAAPKVEAEQTVRADNGDSEDDSESESEVRTEPEYSSRNLESETGQVTAAVISKDGWLLESPAPKYNQFYAEKTWMLPRIMRGGKIPVEKYRTELAEAYVDTKVEMYDHERIAEKMTEIRQWQTRVLQIRGHVLAQFHSWKRAVELFHGVLARAEYAKPAICQQGVIYNHMRDMEMYLADLEYLHDFSKEMLSNLASHFESLSRQVTLSMPLKGVERQEQLQAPLLPPQQILPDTPKPVQKRSDLSGFDRLENNVNQEVLPAQKPKNISTSIASGSTPKKNMDWGDID